MKKLFILALLLLAVTGLAACGGPNASGTQNAAQDIPQNGDGAKTPNEKLEITLWTFPVGDWSSPTALSGLISGFRRVRPDIRISVEYLDYTTGDGRISEAIADGSTPDLVFESPERIVAGWGARGLMADLSDLWEEGYSDEIYEPVRTACRYSGSGEYYVYPVCMTAHCMAINRNMFEAAGALQYLDEDTRTWTTEGFIKAVNTLYAYGQELVGAVYCDGQSGDQGTRALVNNLYGGSFTDSGHTRYVADSAENIRALELLRELDGIVFDPEAASDEDIERFCQGKSAMTFCWNASLEVAHTVQNPDLDFDILPMAFPAGDGNSKLQDGIWGFGLFDNGDEARAEAAKDFIRYVTGDDAQYTRAVQMSSFWPVRDMENIYANDALMAEYSLFIPYMGDYCQVTPNWTEARRAWWTMLQKVGAGSDIAAALKEFSDAANGPLNGG